MCILYVCKESLYEQKDHNALECSYRARFVVLCTCIVECITQKASVRMYHIQCPDYLCYIFLFVYFLVLPSLLHFSIFISFYTWYLFIF